MKIKIISLIITILLIPIVGLSLDTQLSPDGKWLAINPFTDFNSVTIGLISTSTKIYNFKLFCFYNETFIFSEEYKTREFRKYMVYRDLNSIYPNFTNIRYIIYADGNPVVAYETHTNGSGKIFGASIRWLN